MGLRIVYTRIYLRVPACTSGLDISINKKLARFEVKSTSLLRALFLYNYEELLTFLFVPLSNLLRRESLQLQRRQVKRNFQAIFVRKLRGV